MITVLKTHGLRHTRSMSTRSTRRSILTGGAGALLATLALWGTGTATAAAAECPNEQLRIENNSTALPDCRAYEQVTPTYKQGIGLGSVGAIVHSLSNDGDSVAYTDMGSFGGSLQNTISNAYLARRTANGWVTESTAPSSAEYEGSGINDSSADLNNQLLILRTPTEPSNAGNFYLRNADGTLAEIGPLAPEADAKDPPSYLETSVDGFVDYIGASEDLSHVMFWAQGFFVPLPGDETNGRSLFEYVGTGHHAPQLVLLTNTGGELDRCGFSLGHPGRPLMSRDGRTIVFEAEGCEGRPQAAYARVGGVTTVELSSSQCTRTSSDPGGACNEPANAGVAGAAANGSITYITTSQQLVNSDIDQGQDLYACILPPGSIAPQGSVNRCPSLEPVSVTGTSAGANVQEVVDVSEDGNRVAFIATGALTGTSTNAVGEQSVKGAENLYMYDRDAMAGEHMKFIGDICSGSGMSGSVADPRCPQSPSASDGAPNAQMASADGRYMIFSTYARLDSGDTDEAQDVYRYDAETGSLARISIGHDGYGNNGNATDANAVFPITYHGFPGEPVYSTSYADFHKATAISENGERVFFTTTEALVPQDTNGQSDVYEWENGHVYLISDGVAPAGSELVSATPSGDNVVFTTADQLTWQDGDTAIDAYDARVGGGFPAPATASCSGEACQGSPPTPGTPRSLGSLTVAGEGTVVTGSSADSSSPLTVSATKTVAGPDGTLSVKLAGGGRLVISGPGLKSTSVSVTKAGTLTVKILLTNQARAKLRKRHALKINAKVLFTTASGQASTATVALIFKEAHSSKSASKARKGHS